MLQAIIFDLDGVLIDSEPLMRFAFAASYRQVIGEGEPPIESYLEHMGESFPHIMKHLGLPLSLWQPYRELCGQHIDRINVFPESRTLLARLAERKHQISLLTGKDRARTMQVLDHFEMSHLFDLVVASDELSRPKPDPEGMLRTLDQLNCPPQAAVMIGDAVSDIVCAQRAGVTAIAVTWGIKPERVQQHCQPDYTVHTWEELERVLLDLHRRDDLQTDAQQAALEPARDG